MMTICVSDHSTRDIYFELEYERKKQEEIQNQSDKSSDFLPNKRRNQILAAVFAVTAYIAFGLYNDMFTVSYFVLAA